MDKRAPHTTDISPPSSPLLLLCSHFSQPYLLCVSMSLSACLPFSLLTVSTLRHLSALLSQINLLHEICCMTYFLRDTPWHRPAKSTQRLACIFILPPSASIVQAQAKQNLSSLPGPPLNQEDTGICPPRQLTRCLIPSQPVC